MPPTNDSYLILMTFISIAFLAIPGLIAYFHEWSDTEERLPKAKPAIWHLRPSTAH